MKVCLKPFRSAEFHIGGDVYVCCPSWMRKPIGNLNTNSVEEIWNSPEAKDIRASIIDGSFRFCDRSLCPFLSSGNLPELEKVTAGTQALIQEKITHMENLPSEIMLNYDQSCNLSCPSCRTKLIVHNPGSADHTVAENYTNKIHDQFLASLKDNKLLLNITGSGDPFASHVYRELLETLDGVATPNLRIELQTNGLLLTPANWEKLRKIWKNIDRIFVSIDAASEGTYVKVRRGGNWKTLQNNMRFLCDLRSKRHIKYLQVNFVVQKSNYEEMPAFARMFIDMGCDVVSFSLLNDWSTWSKNDFHEQLVWKTTHPEHERFLEALSDDILLSPKVFIGNLSEFQREARLAKWKKLSTFQKTVSKSRQLWRELRRRKFFVPGIIQDLFRDPNQKV